MSITKRLLSAILTVCMIVAMVPATAIAAEETKIAIKPVTVEEGSTEVTVSLAANGAWEEDDELLIKYDTDVFTFDDSNDVDADIFEIGKGSKKQNYAIKVTCYEDGEHANTAVGTVSFIIADGAAAGTYEFTCDGEVVGSVTIAAPSYEGFTLVFDADKTEVEPGDTIKITYKLYNIPEEGLTQYQFYNNFNKRALEFTSAKVPATFGEYTNYGTVNKEEAMLCGTVSPNVILQDKLVVGEATFTVKATAANGTYVIDETIVDLKTTFAYANGDSQIELPHPTIVPAEITVSGSTASAYEDFTLEATAKKTEVQPGDTFTVDYKICAVPANGLGGWQFHIDYNEDMFTLTKVQITPTVDGNVNYGTSNLKGLVCGTFQLFNLSADTVVATATFTVKETAQDGEYAIGYNTAVDGDTFYWVDIDGSATGTVGTMTDYENPAEVPAVVTVTGGVAKTITVNWVVDGETVETATYAANEEEPAYTGETPVKPATAEKTYTFTGWAKTVEGDTVTYTAEFAETTNTYTVTWVVGETVTTEEYEYGATPSYKGSVAKPADAQYTYKFAGFEPAIAAVTGDATYTAVYTTTVKTYTVTWNVAGVTTTETYEYGAEIEYKGSTDKATDTKYAYTFAGWTIAGVTYWVYNGQYIVDSGEVNEEGEPVYVYATLPTVTGNMSATAVYDEEALIWVYGTGMENWSSQTQLLVSVSWTNGETEDVAKAYTYIFTIEGKTYTWATTSNYFAGDWAIMRFQPCLEEDQWIPENGKAYTVGVIIKDGANVMYEGSMDVVLNADPIVPAAREAAGGKIMEGLYWYYDGAETLTIYGDEMPERLPFSYDAAPWKEVEGYITTVKFEGYMTQISREACAHMPALTTVYVGEGVTTIWNDAFAYVSSLKTIYLPSTLTTLKQGTVWASGNISNVYYTGTAEDWANKVKTIVVYNDNITNHLQYCTVTASGEDEGYTWTVYSNGTAIFQGEGASATPTCTGGAQPWAGKGIKNAYFFGFKELGRLTMSGVSGVETAWVAKGTETLWNDAFAHISTLKQITIPADIVIKQGVVYGTNNITTVIFGGCPSDLTAVASAAPYNTGILNAEAKLCMADDPTWTTLSLTKYGSGMENWSGDTQILVILGSSEEANVGQLWDARADYEWVITIDGKAYTWQPDSYAWASETSLFVRFTPMQEADLFIPENGKAYHIESVVLMKDGEIAYKATSKETWTLNEEPIYPAEGIKLNLTKWDTGMENWPQSAPQTQILTVLKHNAVDVPALFENRANYVWEITIDGVAYRYAPSTFYGGGLNIVRFEPCVNSDFVPVKDQEYSVSVKIYAADGETLMFYTDTVGGFKITVDPVVPHTHSYTPVVTPATCTEGGYTTYVCECGDSYVADYTEALGHAWDEGVVTTAPTSQTEGEKTYTCANCGETKTEAVAALGMGDVSALVGGATITNPNTDVTQIVIANTWLGLSAADEVLGRVEGYWAGISLVAPATATAAAQYKNGANGEYKPLQADGQYWGLVTVEYVNTAMTYGGWIAYTWCVDWDGNGTVDQTVILYVNAETVHLEVAVAEVPATCTTEGATAGIVCAVCGTVKSGVETIPALGHTVEEIPGVEPTCTETGLTAGEKCSVCGEILVAQEEIPALGHTEEEIPAVAATCTEDGLTAGLKCSVCGETLVEQEVVPALGHEYGIVEVEGEEYGLCVRCGDKLSGFYTINEVEYYFAKKTAKLLKGITMIYSQEEGVVVVYDLDAETGANNGRYTGVYNGVYYEDGVVGTGFYEDSYYLNGVAQVGPIVTEDGEYYVPTKNNAGKKILKNGKAVVEGKTYWYGEDGLKEHEIGAWAGEVGTSVYYKTDNTTFGEGLGTIRGVVYVFDANGVGQGAYTGMYTEENGYTYYYADGVRGTGFYTNDQGVKSYYKAGVIVKGWIEVDGEQYYAYKADGALVVDKVQVVGGDTYIFDAEGKVVVKCGVWNPVTDEEGNVVGYTYFAKKTDPKAGITAGQQLKDGKYMVGSKYYIFDENGICRDYKKA